MFSDCNWTRTHNHLVHKRTLNHLAKLVRDMIRTYSKMFRFIKKVFVIVMTLFSFLFNALNVNSLKCVSMNNQQCKIRTKIIDINNNEPLKY